VEHRHDRRVACELSVELFRAGASIGRATALNISNEGAHIRTDIQLKRNEMINVVFLDDATLPGWPVRERAIVAHVEDGHAGLWFGRIEK
jgi:hypothetical protein